MESTPPSAGEPFDATLRTSWERLGGIFTEVAGQLEVIQAENRRLVDRVEALDGTVRELRKELGRVESELEEARRPASALPLDAWLGEVEHTARARLEGDPSLDGPSRAQLDALRAIAHAGRIRAADPDAAGERGGPSAGASADAPTREAAEAAPDPAESTKGADSRYPDPAPRRRGAVGNGAAVGDPRPPLPEWEPPTREVEEPEGEVDAPHHRAAPEVPDTRPGGSRPGGSVERGATASSPENPVGPVGGEAERVGREEVRPPLETAPAGDAPSRGPSPRSRAAGLPSRAVPLRKPLYEPTLWDERFGWFDDAVARLDPAPLVRRLAPGGERLSRWVGRLVLPAAELQERLARGVATAYRRIQGGVGAAVRAVPLPPAAREALWLDRPREAASDPEGAHGVLKRRYGAVFWSAVILSVGLHTVLFALWPDFRADDIAVVSDEIRTVEMPPEVEVPPPPQQIARPAVPVVGAEAVADDITIAPTTFEDNPVENLPPPPEAGGGSTGPGEPSFTPFTVAPSIQNRSELVRMIRDSYPPALRDAGIGGEVVVWFYIDESGTVQDTRVARSSGYEALDAAALRVADRFRFTPALNRDNAVAVWVQFPITFVSR